jgi:hypothetical protein
MPDPYTVLPDGTISNPEGQVAMRYLNAGHIRVICNRDDKKQVQYDFIYRNNVSMAWATPADVPCLLAVRGGCCGNKRPGVIKQASELDARYWLGLGR